MFWNCPERWTILSPNKFKLWEIVGKLKKTLQMFRGLDDMLKHIRQLTAWRWPWCSHPPTPLRTGPGNTTLSTTTSWVERPHSGIWSWRHLGFKVSTPMDYLRSGWAKPWVYSNNAALKVITNNVHVCSQKLIHKQGPGTTNRYSFTNKPFPTPLTTKRSQTRRSPTPAYFSSYSQGRAHA